MNHLRIGASPWTYLELSRREIAFARTRTSCCGQDRKSGIPQARPVCAPNLDSGSFRYCRVSLSALRQSELLYTPGMINTVRFSALLGRFQSATQNHSFLVRRFIGAGSWGRITVRSTSRLERLPPLSRGEGHHGRNRS